MTNPPNSGEQPGQPYGEQPQYGAPYGEPPAYPYHSPPLPPYSAPPALPYSSPPTQPFSSPPAQHGPVFYGPVQYGPGPYGQPPSVMYVAPAPTNGLATGAMVTGIVSIPLLCCCYLGLLTGAIAAILGVIAFHRSTQIGGLGRSYSIVGIVTGIAPYIVFLFLLLVGMSDSILTGVPQR
jgi:hypothetical protein